MLTLTYIKTVFPEIKGKLSNENHHVEIMTDSRERVDNGLFIPIIGERFDAHQFIEQAIENGAVAALWDRKKEIPSTIPESFVFFFVDDTVQALQQLAKKYRQDVNPIVIGITGSNGKTTTKDLVSSVLATKYRTHRTVGNFNNEIGMPLTILQMKDDTEVLVVEMGMSDFGEIDRLTNIAQPDYAIITNIGESHIEHLGSREGIAKAKLEITNGLKRDGKLLIDGDEKLLDICKEKENVISIGFNENLTVTITNVQFIKQMTTFEVNGKHYEIPLLGAHHAKNATFAITIGESLELTEEQIQTGLKLVEHTSMRFEWLTGKNGVTIINDAYNASPTSMKAAIDVLKQLTGFKRKIVVLGDILELGKYSESLHRSVAQHISFPINIVYTHGNEARVISQEIIKRKKGIESSHFDDKEELINKLQEHANEETIILFKASRGMKFEQFVESLLN